MTHTHRQRWPFSSKVLALLILCMTTSVALTEAEAKNPLKSTSPSTELNTIRGVIKPAVEAIISSEIQARVRKLPLRDGQRFQKNQILVEFECSKLKAELASAQAEFQARVRTLENSQQLSNLHAIGNLELEIAATDVKKAQASVDIAKANVKGCVINAPFSGRVIKTLVNQYESVNPYDKLLSILDDSRFEIELILPSNSLQWLQKGNPFTFTVDETAQTYQATVTELGASIDPVSQTLRVTSQFTSPPKDILSGMSGSAEFPNRPVNTKTKKPKQQKKKMARRDRKTKRTSTDLSLKPQPK